MLRSGLGVDGDVGPGRVLDRLADELRKEDRLGPERRGADVEATDLEQVLDELGEAGHVVVEQFQRGLAPGREPFAVVVEHLDRGVERHER